MVAGAGSGEGMVVGVDEGMAAGADERMGAEKGSGRRHRSARHTYCGRSTDSAVADGPNLADLRGLEPLAPTSESTSLSSEASSTEARFRLRPAPAVTGGERGRGDAAGASDGWRGDEAESSTASGTMARQLVLSVEGCTVPNSPGSSNEDARPPRISATASLSSGLSSKSKGPT